ncbi:opine metallophore biosynthesis dehydrogenase [Paenibacillus arenilitoris]|uniref:Opine metallophore biosynthesis dehydrogenase n=1 Tax=Paenibacillus arenilitoris TaxID=2772299 RepID=A0A927CI23_9BACL|nr:opine metallophore biosynthesis dehydrogenase [Paenibacillus arenilitoris]MBD2868483.1 opine metallophore biosynthesis dehydrogenase [Paenibacillus arenilitoris]
MALLQDVLVAGTGPAAIQLAVLLKRWQRSRVGIAGRRSVRSAPFFEALHQSGRTVYVDTSNVKLSSLQGECRLDAVYPEYGRVEEEWDTFILAVTADAFLPVLEQIQSPVLRGFRCVALLSPTFGSSALVRHYLKERGCDAEVISFSTYLGDTRRISESPPNRVHTAAAKRRVYAGSSEKHSEAVEAFRRLYANAGIELAALESALEAETRNISLYVHPPLFMNDFSLGAIFDRPDVPKYVYKLFPEGPITPVLIREMLEQWKEISAIARVLGAKPLNLLQFMVDDNYPVRPESLPRQVIDGFPELEPIHQQYALYVRYASLLIDPYSEPDPGGRYFDFSAVPLRPVFLNHEGAWEIPRMPKEDDYRLKIIQGIARLGGVPCPTIDRFVSRYEHRLLSAASSLSGAHFSESFVPQSFDKDIERIGEELQLGAAARTTLSDPSNP